MEENNKEITLAQLAQKMDEMNAKMDAGFSFLQEQVVGAPSELNAMSSRVDGLHSRMTALERGGLTEEEKSELMAMVKATSSRSREKNTTGLWK